MKKLNLLDQSTSFKVNDTGTIIPFNAFENNQPFGVTENETSVFRIKNDMGFLKAVNATSAAGGYIFQLNTKDLVGLVPGTYEIELVITDGETNAELIFPDTGFCSFNITTSALTVTGTQIPTMSLDSFKQQLQQYVQIQADTKIQQIKSDFDTYVESVKQGPVGPQGDPGADGKPASIVVGSTKTGDVGSSASVTNVGTSTNAILDFTIPQGPKGDTGENGQSATVNVGNVTSYNPWVCYDSSGKDYFKGYINTDGEHANATDIATDYFQVYANDSYSIALPPTLPPLGTAKLRICWYDSNKTFVKKDEMQNLTFPFTWTVQSPTKGYARVCVYAGSNTDTDGDSQRIVITDIGHPSVTNSGDTNNATFNIQVGAGATGLTGPQGLIGPVGPQGTIGDYVTGTGWLDFSSYMNRDIWCGWDSSKSDDIGYNKYAVTTINGQTILWIRIHSRFKTATTGGTWGTPLFYIPQDIVQQYGGGNMEVVQPQMYNCNNTLCASQVMGGTYTFNGQSFTRRVETRGAFQMQNNQSGQLPDSTQTVNYFCWYVI